MNVSIHQSNTKAKGSLLIAEHAFYENQNLTFCSIHPHYCDRNCTTDAETPFGSSNKCQCPT